MCRRNTYMYRNWMMINSCIHSNVLVSFFSISGHSYCQTIVESQIPCLLLFEYYCYKYWNFFAGIEWSHRQDAQLRQALVQLQQVHVIFHLKCSVGYVFASRSCTVLDVKKNGFHGSVPHSRTMCSNWQYLNRISVKAMPKCNLVITWHHLNAVHM